MSAAPRPIPATAPRVPGSPPGRRTAELLALAGVAGLVVGLVVGLLAGGLVGAVIGAVVVGLAVPGALWQRAGSWVEGGKLGSAADPVAHARLVNLVEGIAATAGVKVPALRVVPGPGLNLAVSGREASDATLVVTAPTLDALTRMELEGLVAVGAAVIRRGETRPGTLAAAAGGLLAGHAVGTDRDRLLDESAAGITRYPPGLMAAYEKLEATGTSVTGASRHGAHLWIADPDPAPGGACSYRTPIRLRIDALAEL